MKPLSQARPPGQGDVLYHPAMGFATVTGVDEGGLELSWEEAGASLPRRISADASHRGYRLCPAEGFFARSVRAHDALATLVQTEPARSLWLLLRDLQEPAERADIRQWLVRRRLISEEGFDGWWDELPLADNPRFDLREGRLSCGLDPDDDEDTDLLPRLLSNKVPTPWDEAPRLEGLDLVLVGMELLGLLAPRHASGRGIGLNAGQVTVEPDGRLTLGHSEPAGRPDADTYQAGRMLVQRALGRRLPEWLTPHRILAHLNGLGSPVAPSAMRLLEELLSPLRSERAPDAIGAYGRWSAAAAIEEVRRSGVPLQTERSLRWGADTHIGRGKMRGNQANQDAWGVCELDDSSLFLVADGISVSDAGSGDQASRIAVDTVIELWRKGRGGPRDPLGTRRFYEEILREANRRICHAAVDAVGGHLGDHIPMGTTLTLAALRGDRVDLVHLGDSRAWLLGQLGCGLLSCDQNVELQWLTGERSAEQDDEELAGALVGYLGHFDDEGVPRLRPPWFRRLRMLPGERLVLCTDGVHDYATDTQLALAHLVEGLGDRTPEAMATALVEAANAGGGGDNATALVVAIR